MMIQENVDLFFVMKPGRKLVDNMFFSGLPFSTSVSYFRNIDILEMMEMKYIRVCVVNGYKTTGFSSPVNDKNKTSISQADTSYAYNNSSI